MALVENEGHNCKRGVFAIVGWRELARNARESPPPTLIAKSKSSQATAQNPLSTTKTESDATSKTVSF